METDRTRHSRALWASFVGTGIEFYDFYIYATAASLVFGQIFFPPGNPGVQQMASFATLAVAFFARPVGAAVFGHYGDRIGRKATLVASLLTMGLSTTLVAFLPTYASVGWVAPVLLCLLRFGQGFGLGSEWGGAALLAVPLFATVFEGRLIAGGMASRMRSSVLGPIDRALGFGFGALKGLILSSLAFLAVVLLLDLMGGGPARRPAWVVQARTYPLLNATSAAIADFVDTPIDLTAELPLRNSALTQPPETAKARANAVVGELADSAVHAEEIAEYVASLEQRGDAEQRHVGDRQRPRRRPHRRTGHRRVARVGRAVRPGRRTEPALERVVADHRLQRATDPFPSASSIRFGDPVSCKTIPLTRHSLRFQHDLCV